MRLLRVMGLILLVAVLGCRTKPEPSKDQPTVSKATASPESRPVSPPAGRRPQTRPARTFGAGDPSRGKALIAQFECNRCHEGTGHAPMADEKHCVRCHDNIVSGKVRAPGAVLTRWKTKVEGLRDAPSLHATGARFRREWLESFLLEPRDLRPGLVSTMPRLALSAVQARDIAAYLTLGLAGAADADSPTGGEAPGDATTAAGKLDLGRRLFEEKSCGRCHAFSGAPGAASLPNVNLDNAKESERRDAALAPDLRVTRERFKLGALVAWLRDPPAMKPDTRMPNHNLSLEDAQHLARWIVEAPLEPLPRRAPPRLPAPLARRVTFAEVQERVLGVTCGHCHGNPDVALGDGGPGNTGGFGFSPKRLDLTTYAAVAAGYVDPSGERHSVFAPTADGTPRLVAALLARHAEETGQPNAEVRGMPLGLPPLAIEDIQLVATWIAQGRPR